MDRFVGSIRNETPNDQPDPEDEQNPLELACNAHSTINITTGGLGLFSAHRKKSREVMKRGHSSLIGRLGATISSE